MTIIALSEQNWQNYLKLCVIYIQMAAMVGIDCSNDEFKNISGLSKPRESHKNTNCLNLIRM